MGVERMLRVLFDFLADSGQIWEASRQALETMIKSYYMPNRRTHMGPLKASGRNIGRKISIKSSAH